MARNQPEKYQPFSLHTLRHRQVRMKQKGQRSIECSAPVEKECGGCELKKRDRLNDTRIPVAIQHETSNEAVEGESRCTKEEWGEWGAKRTEGAR